MGSTPAHHQQKKQTNKAVRERFHFLFQKVKILANELACWPEVSSECWGQEQNFSKTLEIETKTKMKMSCRKRLQIQKSNSNKSKAFIHKTSTSVEVISIMKFKICSTPHQAFSFKYHTVYVSLIDDMGGQFHSWLYVELFLISYVRSQK